jgi:hypothetical protein
MKWNFTPAQVMEGKADYSLEEFLRDLWEEVRSNSFNEDFSLLFEEENRDRKYDEAIRDVFNFVYEICYLAVNKKKYLKIILKKSNETERKLIKKTIKENKNNIAMLHAILMKHIARGLNKGLTKKQAANAAVEYSKELICKWSMRAYKNKQAEDHNLKEKRSGQDRDLSKIIIERKDDGVARAVVDSGKRRKA